MTGRWWLDALLAAAGGLAVCWLLLIVVLALNRPRGPLLQDAIRLLPDLLRLIRRLAADPQIPTAARIRIGVLIVYLAVPIDLIPDFIPVLGYADDAIVVTVVLRSVVRCAGLPAVRAHWPGTDDGFAALSRLAGLADRQPAEP